MGAQGEPTGTLPELTARRVEVLAELRTAIDAAVGELVDLEQTIRRRGGQAVNILYEREVAQITGWLAEVAEAGR